MCEVPEVVIVGVPCRVLREYIDGTAVGFSLIDLVAKVFIAPTVYKAGQIRSVSFLFVHVVFRIIP